MKQTKLNPLSSWEVVTFQEIGDFLRGPFGSSVKKSVCVSKGSNTFKLYEQGNAIQNDFVRGDYYITKEKFKELKKFELLTEDIVITCAGTLGKIAIVPENIEQGIINSVLMRIRLDNSKILKKYFLYYFQSPRVQSRIHSKCSGATIKNLFATKKLKSFKIPLPPISVQRQIVAILDKAEKIKQTRQQANQMPNKILHAVFFQMFGDPSINPKQFKETNLISVCSKIIDCPHTTPIYSDLGIPLIRTPNIKKGFIDFDITKFVSWEEHCKRLTRIHPIEGDILYAREAPFGNAALVKANKEFSVGQRIMLLRPNPVLIRSEFLVSLINSDFVYAQAKRLARGSTNPHVNVGDVKKFKIMLPPIDLQSKFASFTKSIDNLKKHQKKSTIEIQNLFNSLMYKAFKGELHSSVPDN